MKVRTFFKTILPAMLALVLPLSASAQSATKQVSVGATLASKCLFADGSDVTLPVASYQAFSAIAVEVSADVDVQCTRGGPAPTLAFTASDVGVVAGLTFQLSASYTAGSSGAAPAGASASDLGSPRTGTFTVKATFPAGQAGTDGASAPVVRTMTVSF